MCEVSFSKIYENTKIPRIKTMEMIIARISFTSKKKKK